MTRYVLNSDRQGGGVMKKLKVLVVDDEPGMRRGAAKALRKYRVKLDEINTEVSFEIDEAADGAECFKALEAKKYDLMLLDYKLPDISGLDILERVRQGDYDLLTIMITAYASLEVAISATKNGAFDFLAKPFTPDELKAVVRKTASSLLLQRLARQLEEEKRQVRFQFLSVLSHELKAPLNAIEGYLRILEDRTAGDDLKSYEKMVNRSLDRITGMRKLIFDMLDLTRIESGQKQRVVEPIDVLDAAHKSIENQEPDAKKRNISIKFDAPEKVEMNGDSGELEIIFNNLVSNAVKYNREGGKVDVAVAKDGDIVTVKVSDTGIGMTKEEQSKLFGEFVRIKNEKTRLIEGSGLGLSILKRLSKLYEGDVTVESEADKGTTFTVVLKDLPKEEENE